MNRPATRTGAALLGLGALAVVRAFVLAAPPAQPWECGEAVSLRVEDLAGDEFRLLPGVGPVLAQRLEAARKAAGGRLPPDRVRLVSGVGPVLAARWAALRPDAEAQRARAPPERPTAP